MERVLIFTVCLQVECITFFKLVLSTERFFYYFSNSEMKSLAKSSVKS